MMIMRKRAELDTVNPPGQIINRYQTIGAIIDRIMKDESPKDVEPKKLTFEEWWNFENACRKQDKEKPAETECSKFFASRIWRAAQLNK